MPGNEIHTPSVGRQRMTLITLAILASLLLGGCASLGANKSAADQKAEQQTAQQRRATRQELNEGYSLLYMSVSSLSNVDKVFYVKVESDSVQRVIGDVSDYAGQLKSDLERIAKNYPAVKINLDPLPEIEKLKRESISTDTRKSLLPVVGKTGPAFERKLLLSSSGALDQLRFKCKVMAAEEPVDSLRKFLVDAQRRLTELYNEDVKLLNEQYFKDNTYEPKPLPPAS